jgi:hypothetical protein
MRRSLVCVVLAPLLSCARGAESGVANAQLRAELLQRVAADQAVRDTMMRGMRAGAGAQDTALTRRVDRLDSVNTAWLVRQQPAKGWFTRAQVGADGVAAAFLLLQHAADTAWQARALPVIQTAVAQGDVSGQEFALFADRIAMRRGLPQQYGTQVDVRDGRVVFYLIADSSTVDARRAQVGLMPLREYARLLDSMYVGAQK